MAKPFLTEGNGLDLTESDADARAAPHAASSLLSVGGSSRIPRRRQGRDRRPGKAVNISHDPGHGEKLTMTDAEEGHLSSDGRQLAAILEATHDVAVRIAAGLDDRPVLAPGWDLEPTTHPLAGLGAHAALDAFVARYDGHLSGSAGPRYWGFVTGGVPPRSTCRRLAGSRASTTRTSPSGSTRSRSTSRIKPSRCCATCSACPPLPER